MPNAFKEQEGTRVAGMEKMRGGLVKDEEK